MKTEYLGIIDGRLMNIMNAEKKLVKFFYKMQDVTVK
jgi:hypothetical protein